MLWEQPVTVVWLAMAASCSLGFVMLRAAALQRCLDALVPGHGVGYLGCARLFVCGVALETFSWPGKIWADGYRAAQMRTRVPGLAWHQAAATLAVWRVTSMVGTLIVLASIGATVSEMTLLSVLQVLILVTLGAGWCLHRIRLKGSPAGIARPLVVAAGCAVGASVSDLGCLVLIATSLSDLSIVHAASVHAIAAPAGALSPLPLGLGGYEAAFIAASGLSLGGAAAVLMTYRLVGPGLTLAMGCVMLMGDASKIFQRVRTTMRRNVLSYVANWQMLRPVRGASLRGFTLVELIAVIVVLGILAAVAVPRFFNYGDRATESLARSVYAQLQSARTGYLAAWGKMPNRINTFVALDGQQRGSRTAEDGREINVDSYVFYVTTSLRSQLVNPTTEVLVDDPAAGREDQIVLNFKNGATAAYSWETATIAIHFTFTQP